MNGRLRGWSTIVGAVVFSWFGLSSGIGHAAGTDPDTTSSIEFTATDAYEMQDLDSLGQGEELPMLQRYAPPPPRRRYWRPYRPYWNFRVVPPPVFAPGWFGLYFLGTPPREPEAPAPRSARRRDFRHVNDYSLGVTGGGYYGVRYRGESENTGRSSYTEFADPGVRFSLQYRNTPVVGAELAVGIFGTNMRLDGEGTTARSDIPIQLSGILHLFPTSPIQPYVVLGATGDVRTYAFVDEYGNYGDQYTELRVGPHVGVGLELLIGDRIGLTGDVRRVFYTLIDQTVQGQSGSQDATATLGLNFYF